MGLLSSLRNWAGRLMKGGPAGWLSSTWTGGPMFVDWNRTRRGPAPPELVEAYKQVVYACACLNATGVARVPLRLFAITKQGKRPKSYLPIRRLEKAERRRLVSARGHTAKAFQTYTTSAEDVDEVLEHPLLDALHTVNPDWDYSLLLHYTVYSLDVVGRAYWWMEQQQTANKVWPLLAQYVLPIRDPSTSLIQNYHYFDQEYTPEQLVRIRHLSLRDPYAMGYGPTEAAFSYVGLADQYVSVQENLLTQGVRPSIIVSNKDPAEPMGKEERGRFQRDINTSLSRGGTGLAWVVDGSVDVKTLSFPPSDMAALQISENAVQRIANCFGVPLSLLKTEDVNLANAEAGHRQHAELAIDPRCVMIASALTKWTRAEGKRVERALGVEMGWDRLFWAFDNPVKEDEQRTATIHDMYLKNQTLVVNEVRNELGYPDVEWGWKPWIQGSLVQPGEEPEEEEEEQPKPGQPDKEEAEEEGEYEGEYEEEEPEAKRLKYDDSERRDENGQWTSGGGSSDSKPSSGGPGNFPGGADSDKSAPTYRAPVRGGVAQNLGAATAYIRAHGVNVDMQGYRGIRADHNMFASDFIIASYSIEKDRIFLNETFDGKRDLWYDPAKVMKEEHADGLYSSDNVSHVADHELAHALQGKALGKDYMHKLDDGRFDRATEKMIESKVSRYASATHGEFVAEVFAGMRAGKTYDAQVMKLYNGFNGPRLKAAKK